MSVSDELMWRYIDLLSLRPNVDIRNWKDEVAGGRNPRDIKVAFAQEMVERFHDHAAAERALADFNARFREGALPENMPEIAVTASAPIALRAGAEAGHADGKHLGGDAHDRSRGRACRWGESE